MGLSSLLSIARSALLTHRRAMDVTANNIANAQTPGYSRQRLLLTSLTPVDMGNAVLGRGVTDEGVARIRDTLLDSGYRSESGLLGQAQTTKDFLAQVESALGEPTSGGLGATMDSFFQSFSSLANDPSNPVQRDLVRSSAVAFTNQLNGLAQRLASANSDAVARMQTGVQQANTITAQIADLNARILASPGPLQNSADLQDSRDQLVDQLSSLVNVTVTQRSDGTIAVAAGDATLVDGASVTKLQLRSTGGGGYGVATAQGAGVISLQSGSLAALSNLTTTTLPGWRTQLDQLAKSVVTEVNAIHETGTTRGGATGTDFFDPSGVTALTISVSSAIQVSSDAIAAGATAAAGDGSIALQISQLVNQGVNSLGGRTFRDVYARFAADVGTQSSTASDQTDAEQTLVDRADAARDNVSGVSIDEEMVNLLNEQQAYQAAARLVVTAQDMIDTVIQMVQ